VAARRLVPLTLALVAACYATIDTRPPAGHSPSSYEGNGVCDYYGPYGPRSSYWDAPGSGWATGLALGPNDHPYIGGGPVLGYSGGVVYGPMPPGYCPREER
jgi:hypothetical protein